MQRSFWRENRFWLTVLGVLLVVLVYMFMPVSPDGHEPAGKTGCLSNMKQTATATAIYMGDHEERLPLENWMTSLMPFTRNRDMMGCPQVIRDDKHFGYALKLWALGINVTKVEDPVHTVMFFETEALGESVVANLAARCARHTPTGSNVSFMDAHARFMKLNDPKLK